MVKAIGLVPIVSLPLIEEKAINEKLRKKKVKYIVNRRFIRL